MDGSQPRYSQEEVYEILKSALAQQAGREGLLSHDELVEIANEAGIEREALDQAMSALAQQQTRAMAQESEAAELAVERKLQAKRFGAALVSHGLLNAVLYLFATRVTGGAWYVWPLLGSSILLALQLRNVLFPYDKLVRRRKREQRERDRERRRVERERWRQRWFGGSRGGDAGKAIETAVQKGVSLLVALAERKLDEHKQRDDAGRPKR
jgi:hypothetical protein